jgi:hypothetical protein
MGRDNRPLVAEQGVEQGRLPRVRRPDDDDPHPVADPLAGRGRGQQGRQPLATADQPRRLLIGIQFDGVIDEIQ